MFWKAAENGSVTHVSNMNFKEVTTQNASILNLRMTDASHGTKKKKGMITNMTNIYQKKFNQFKFLKQSYTTNQEN